MKEVIITDTIATASKNLSDDPKSTRPKDEANFVEGNTINKVKIDEKDTGIDSK